MVLKELNGFLQNTEILRALQKASGLSPDEEPIKLLSVPKGALGKSSLVLVSQGPTCI